MHPCGIAIIVYLSQQLACNAVQMPTCITLRKHPLEKSILCLNQSRGNSLHALHTVKTTGLTYGDGA